MSGVHGAVARLTGIGHPVTIMSDCRMSPEAKARHRPKVVLGSPKNGVERFLEYDAA